MIFFLIVIINFQTYNNNTESVSIRFARKEQKKSIRDCLKVLRICARNNCIYE